MRDVRLIAISDSSVLTTDALVGRFAQLARAAKPGRVALLLRDHAASAAERLALGERLASVARSHQQELWVADRADLAILLDADVLHLGEASVRAARLRSWLPNKLRISRAWHEPRCDGARAQAELADVDALLLSPVVAARKGRPALGLAALDVLGEQLRARNSAYPLFALGGISADNAGACLSAGATGVAAIGAALTGPVEPLLAGLGIAR